MNGTGTNGTVLGKDELELYERFKLRHKLELDPEFPPRGVPYR